MTCIKKKKKKKFITKSGLPFAVDAARSVYYYTLVTIQAMKIYFSILKIIHLFVSNLLLFLIFSKTVKYIRPFLLNV